jgi:ribonuclease VapC
MIAVDTSVLVAILLDEPERDEFIRFIAQWKPAHLSAVSLQEAGMILRSRRGTDGVKALFDLTAALQIQIVAYDEPQARLAIDAFGHYGKGRHSKARLNMGDCASYALAKSLNIPLMFKGEDFKATDIVAAV